MSKQKSAGHHWWPRCVSARWAAGDGQVGWVKPDGTCVRLPPQVLGVITNAHHIKFGRDSHSPTEWDSSFEGEFDKADRNFTSVIDWLESLYHEPMLSSVPENRFLPHAVDDEQLRLLTECVVSLAVRSPRNREASVAFPERVRGPIPDSERNTLIGYNMRRSQRLIADSIGSRGKFAILFSLGREFIFGDGFFHNVTAVVDQPSGAKILAPITPKVSVIVSRPTSFAVQPRLSTIVVTNEEVDRCNSAVQVYSRNALFFRSDRPMVKEEFSCGQHMKYSHPDNPIDEFIGRIPGIRSR